MNNKICKIMSSVLLSAFISCLFLTSCPNSNISTEINRCLLINKKIDYAQNKLDELDSQMAQSDHYQVFEVGTNIYDFDLGNGLILKTLVSFPIDKSDASPVVIFSHGMGASAESQLYLTSGLARRGNIVIAPDHHDIINFDRIGLLDEQLKLNKSTDIIEALEYIIINMIAAQNNPDFDFINSLTSMSDEELAALAAAGRLIPMFDEYFYYRVNDIKFLLDQLDDLNASDPILRNKIDFDKLIMAGHSLGGAIALRLATENNPFKAFLCLSPASQPFTSDYFTPIHKPVLYLTGDCDDFYDITQQAFDYTNPPKLLVSLKDSGHVIFTDRVFLYGLGVPFISNGEIGFTANLPIDKINIDKINIDLISLNQLYPRQLHDYQGKSLAIVKAVNAFIDLYVNNNPLAADLLDKLKDHNLVDEFIFDPQT